ncbi:AI-2E family transporter [Ruficoccus amylovorans]|uniref:AI-2E family transporter n=1 Tax=Ruficoccus amylovorans TaxID=1804625 RepID=A0A842HB18_9BACT|nr:AI-2E family transporter [Ruficoccus amylovorans]MBC2593575.1 AI-2E family transporter [Ruficoccus amylovorans]
MGDKQPNKVFSDLQKRIVVAALTALGVVFLCAVVLLCFYLLKVFVSTFSGVLWPLAAAGILAMLLRPVVSLISRKLHLGLIPSILILYVIAILIAGVGVYAIFELFDKQIIVFFKTLPDQITELIASIRQKFPDLMDMGKNIFGEQKWAAMMDQSGELANRLLEVIKNSAGSMVSILQKSGKGVLTFFGLSAQFAIIPVYLFFLLLSDRDFSQDLKRELVFVNDKIRDDIVFLVREFVGIIVSFFRGQIVIGLIMGVCYAIGFSLVGLKFGFFIGMAMGFLNIIPYLGTILGLGMALPIGYLQSDGGVSTVIWVLGVFAAVQALEGYFLTPRIMGKQTGLHPMVIIIAIFFWGTALDGILGMILAIPLTAFFVVLWRLVKVKYLPMLMNKDDATSTLSAEEASRAEKA